MARIDEIRSLEHKNATKLRKAGVRTTEALLKRANSRAGRSELSAETDIATSELLSLVNLADLMRIKGLGGEYVELLSFCGVKTLGELRRRSPVALSAKIHEVNERKDLVKRLPTESMVGRWIGRAAELDQIVKH